MQPSSSLRGEARLTLRLAFPLVIGQLSQMALGLADTLMLGRVGVLELAACAMVNSILHLPLLFGIGMLTGVSVLVSQARGAKDPRPARSALRNGLYLAGLIGIVMVLGSWLLFPWFGILRQDPEVLAISGDYFLLIATSMGFALLAQAVKNHADAMNRPWPVFWIMTGGVVLNIFLNWILIYGNWGAPALGLNGAGWATLAARIVTFGVMVYWCARSVPAYREWLPQRWLRGPEWATMRNLTRLGFPAAIHMSSEVGSFVVATLMIGGIGSLALAAHQVAITCAAMVFMVPLGTGMALTVRIGESWGSHEYHRLRSIVVSGTLMMVLFAVATAAGFLAFRYEIAAFFSNEPEAVALAAALLAIAAAFQIGDALQITSSCALRGMDDVRVPAMVAFGSYWILALPLGWVLAFPLGLGARGIWWGITLGLWTTAVVLGLRLLRKTRPAPGPRTGEDAA